MTIKNSKNYYDFTVYFKPLIANLRKKTVKLPWVPKIEPNFREKLIKQFEIKAIITFGNKLSNLICCDKLKLLANSFPDVYLLDCACYTHTLAKLKKQF